MVISVHELINTAGIEKLDAEVILAHLLNCKRSDFILNGKSPVNKEVCEKFFERVKKRQQGCPVAYIVGEKEFYSLPFYVSEDCLIPRPDTEVLAEWGIEKSKNKRVLDLCSGSGCIGVCVAHYANAKVTFADISERTLKIASKNAERNGVSGKFLKLDILKDDIKGEFDVILSNPPYIESEEVKKLDTDVKDYEPHLALDGGSDGLKFYPIIIEKAAKNLAKGGYLGFEVGHKQAHIVADMMQKAGFKTELIADFGGILRVCAGQKE